MKDRIREFFRGRYGLDELGQLGVGLALVFLLLTIVTIPGAPHFLFKGLSFLSLVFVYTRMLSRNIERRAYENASYIFWRQFARLRWRDRKTHTYARCPGCMKYIRIQKHLGRVRVTCKNCGKVFYLDVK